MTDPFVAALDALFSSAMAVDAIYDAPDAPLLPVRAIRSQPSQVSQFGNMQVALASEAVEVRRSEIAMPAPGSVFTIGADRLVMPEHLQPLSDVEGLTWTCWVEPAA
jgi:hypothetical protein